MKFIADVNIGQKVIRLLHQAGHDVVDIKRINPTSTDTEIIKLAKLENRIILTHDSDFLGLVKYPKYRVSMIIIQLRIQNVSHHAVKLQKLLKAKSEEVLKNSLTILTEESADSYAYLK